MASLNLELLKQANAQAAKYAADDDDPPAPPLPRTFKDKPASPNKPKPKKGPAGPPAVSKGGQVPGGSPAGSPERKAAPAKAKAKRDADVASGKVKQDAEDAKNKSREEATAAHVEKSKRDKQSRPVVKRPSSSLTAGDDASLNRARRIAAGAGLGEGYPVDVAYDIDPNIKKEVGSAEGDRISRLVAEERESGGERFPQGPGGPGPDVDLQGGVTPSGLGGDPNVPTELLPGLDIDAARAAEERTGEPRMQPHAVAEGEASFPGIGEGPGELPEGAFQPEERRIAGSNPEELQARIDEQLLRRAREAAAAEEDVNRPPGGGFGRPGTDTGPGGPAVPSLGMEEAYEPPIASLSPEELEARVSGAREGLARGRDFPDFDAQQAQQAVESGLGEPQFDPATGGLVADSTSPGAGGGAEGGPEFVGPQDQQPGSPWYKNPWVIGGAGAAAGAAGLYMVLKALKKRKRRRGEDEDEEEGRGGRRKAAGSYPGAHRKNKGRKKKRVKIGPKGKAYVDDDKDDEKRAHIRRTVISNATARFLHG